MSVKRPDLFDVLEVVRQQPGCQSYVYRNMLAMKGHANCKTDLVLARLKKLQSSNKVSARRAVYARGRPLIWDPVSASSTLTPES